MKKYFVRPLCLILMLAMLVPMMSVMAGAEGEIENLYVESELQLGIPPKGNMNDNASGNRMYHTSGIIPVKAGDVVTFGPILTGQGYFITTYDETGAMKTEKITRNDCTIVEVLTPSVEILKWVVTEGNSYIRVVNSMAFKEATIVTLNREFSAAEFYAEMKKKDLNLDHIQPHTVSEPLVNVFPTSDATFPGRADATKIEIAHKSYCSSDYIPVKPGDVLYFGAAAESQNYQITLYDENKKGTTNVKDEYMVKYGDLGDGFFVYSFKMPHDTAYVRIVAPKAVYDAGKQLATINQPFDAEGYNNYFNPPETTEPAPETTEPAPETTEPTPETTEPAPETTEPVTPPTTGDTALVFAAIAIISLVGVAVIAKRREN